jgi:hypothetical protein
MLDQLEPYFLFFSLHRLVIFRAQTALEIGLGAVGVPNRVFGQIAVRGPYRCLLLGAVIRATAA